MPKLEDTITNNTAYRYVQNNKVPLTHICCRFWRAGVQEESCYQRRASLRNVSQRPQYHKVQAKRKMGSRVAKNMMEGYASTYGSDLIHGLARTYSERRLPCFSGSTAQSVA